MVGQPSSGGCGNSASARNHNPTASITYPPHRRTAGPTIRTGPSTPAVAVETKIAAAARRTTNTRAEVAKAIPVGPGPSVMVCAARPANRGPVQPNPARR